MGVLDSTFVHTCQILSTSQDQRLNFVAGSSAFSVGNILTGETSKSTGVIKTVSVSTGSWAGGDAVGYLVMYSVSDAFVAGEKITDNGLTAGSANVIGSLIPQTNAAGTPTATTITLPSSSSYYDCLFSNVSMTGNYVSDTDAGKVIVSSPMVMLPAGVVVCEGDHVITSEPKWVGTYQVQYIDAPEIPCTGSVDHFEAFLKVVKKRG